MYSEVLVVKLNTIAHQYKGVINRALRDILSQPRYRNTGAGLSSLTVEVIEGNTNKAPQIVVSFDDHILFLDKRKMQWTKLPEIKKLLAWAETRKSTVKEAKKLAWAVAWSKKKTDAWKPKLWRKRGLGPALTEMNKKILADYGNAIEEALTQATKIAA